MKQVLVVFTGGTIGSMKQGESIDVNTSGSYMIIDLFQQQYDSTVAFSTMQPLNILSENLQAQQWLELAKQLRNVDVSKYDGIILTHGSDSLAYTASMLSYLLADIKIPLVLIASNYPLGDERANGLRNFYEAVSWIEHGAKPGVFVVYENSAGESLLYLASRIMQCEPFTDQFRSPYDRVLGKLNSGQLLCDESYKEGLTLEQVQPQHYDYMDRIGLLDNFNGHVLYIKPYPGLNYELYQWDQQNKPVAILHDTYHSGTASALMSGEQSLPQFIKRCKEQGIQLYLCPLKSAEEAKYASTGVLTEAGAILLEGISMEAAITKLMLAYSLFKHTDEVNAFMEQNLYYEKHV